MQDHAVAMTLAVVGLLVLALLLLMTINRVRRFARSVHAVRGELLAGVGSLSSIGRGSRARHGTAGEGISATSDDT